MVIHTEIDILKNKRPLVIDILTYRRIDVLTYRHMHNVDTYRRLDRRTCSKLDIFSHE